MTTNGNGNGHTRKRLEKLLAYHDGIAQALRTTLTILDGDERIAARQNGASVITQAIALDAARAAQNGNGHGNGHAVAPRTKQQRKAYPDATEKRRQRKRTAKILRTLSRTEPRAVRDIKKIAVLMRHGYVAKQTGGYVRTGKEFTV